MSLTYEKPDKKSVPLARVESKKHDFKEYIYVDYALADEKLELKYPEGYKVTPLPQIFDDQRYAVFISGASGSGKSWAAREQIDEIRQARKQKEKPIYYFSATYSDDADGDYVMDKAYLDFARLFRLHRSGAFFVLRAKSNQAYVRRASREVDKATGLRSDQTIALTGPVVANKYPEPLRRVSFYDAEQQRKLVFLTNNFLLPPLTVAQLYRARWQVELFFKWIKQHLRIKAFLGNSENAVKTQVWIAVGVYVLVAILKKELGSPRSLAEILQILSVNTFEKTPLNQLLLHDNDQLSTDPQRNQLRLFDL